MDLLDNKGNADLFTSEMENNKYFNFTSYIKADMKTFLIAVAGNISIFPFAAGIE
jgi:hypothetical protein